MKIASHHQWKDSDYKPHCAWDDDAYVQWGSRGLVLGKAPYNTAFFEAFPGSKENGGFIRGEGSTITEAEDDAFRKFVKQSSCNHLWGREKYTNGGQLCRHCRAFRCDQVKPVVILGSKRAPIHKYEEWLIEEDGDLDGPPSPYVRELMIRRKLFGVDEKRFPF